MSRLSALPPRLAPAGSRLAAQPPQERQTRRQFATNSADWRRIRELVLVRDNYTCRTCLQLVGGRGAAHVDHIDGDSWNNALGNLQTLCVPCHSTKTASSEGGFGNPTHGGQWQRT